MSSRLGTMRLGETLVPDLTLAGLSGLWMTAGMGIPAGFRDWRFAVQIAVATNDDVLGAMRLGVGHLSSVGWLDVTADAHGVEIVRGAPAGSTSGAGQISFRLDNEAGVYDRYLSTYHGPGTLVRVALGAPGTVCPLATGLTIEWNESTAAIHRVRWIDVVALATISLLGEVDNLEVAPVGLGDTMADRVARILAPARWQFGVNIAGWLALATAAWTFQSTNLARDVWTDLLATADTLALVAKAGRDGRVEITEHATGFLAGLATLGVDVPIVADSIVTANDDDRILGTIAVARAGGVATTYTKAGIQGRYQTRASQFFDLLTRDPGGNADLARYANDKLDRGAQTYRVERVELDSGQGDNVFRFIAGLDLGVTVNVRHEITAAVVVTFANYFVCGYTLTIEPVDGESVLINARIETDASALAVWST